MENNLDFTPPNDQNLRKAKTTFHLIAGLFVIILLVSLLYALKVIGNRYDIIPLLIGITSLIMMLLAPVALFYIIKSYRHKEDKKIQKLLYLIGILCFNALFLLFVVRVVFSIRENFFY